MFEHLRLLQINIIKTNQKHLKASKTMQKNAYYKRFSSQNLIKKRAINVMTFHPAQKEWRIPIITFSLLKALTMFLSLIAGYTFFVNFFNKIFNDITIGVNNNTLIIVLSAITLIIIELLTAVFLEKTFKFLYGRKFTAAIFVFFVVIIFYSISFYSSTNGLATWQSNRKDLSVEINKQNSDFNNVLKEEKNEHLAYFNKQILLITNNPLGWSKGKRMYLTRKQLKDISIIEQKKELLQTEFSKNILKAEKDKEKLLLKNSFQKEKTAKYYYKFMSIIMIAQIFATMVLMFLYNLISKEKQANKKPQLLKFSNPIININSSTQIEKNIIGFNKTGFKTSTELARPVVNIGNTENTTNTNLQLISKHKKLVSLIKKTSSDNKKPLSNKEIILIQETADTQYKSRTTIKKVFKAMGIIGFDKIDENGNII